MPDAKGPDERPAAAPDGRTQIRLRYDRAATSYANLSLVTATPEEVVLNFAVNVMPPTPERQVNIEIHSRVIMTYPSAKRLAATLGDVIRRYEATHGVIDLGRPPTIVGDIEPPK